MSRSLRWNLPETALDTANIIDQLLILRGIKKKYHRKFLEPDLADIHAPGLLHNTGAAAAVILEAITKGKKIFIHGDYDVDGVCATAILWDFLYRKLGADALPFIPNRFEDGYGLTENTLDQILALGGELVITVDCGIKDAEVISRYAEKGLQFVISDHHSLPHTQADDLEELFSPAVLAVVHPAHPAGSYPFPEICGANVAWKLASAVNDRAGAGVDMNDYLDLVAMATVCDVMPLVDENRAIVKFGLERTRETSSPGLQELLKITGTEPAGLQAYHYGFVLGPRINASGRLKSAMQALRLLTTRSRQQAMELARELHELNFERQELTTTMMDAAEAQLQAELPLHHLHIVVGENWPEGIVGLVAGKLCEKYHRPVLVGSLAEGKITGSARSIPGLHIADTLKRLDPLLVRHGGHAQAAGFTLQAENLEAFREELQKIAQVELSPEVLEKVLNIDAVVSISQIDAKLIAALESLQPFGFGNATPVFASLGNVIDRVRVFGSDNSHVSFILHDDAGNTLEAVAFGQAANYQHLKQGDLVDAAGTLGMHKWNGYQHPQLKILDIRNAQNI